MPEKSNELQKKQYQQPVDLNLPPEYVERLILVKFFSDRAYANFISENFSPDQFDNETIKQALRVGDAYYKKYGNIPTIEVVSQILEKIGKTEESKLLPSYANFKLDIDEDFSRDAVKNYIRSKSLFNLIFANADKILKERDASPYVSEMARISAIDFYTDIGFDYLNDIEEHIFDLQNPESRISTGYPELDYATNGGFPTNGKCLIVFMAQPGLGKSMMMHNLAVNFIRSGKKVLIVSLEMTEQIYARRISANLTQMNINQLQLPANLDLIRSEVANIRESQPNSKLIIKEFPPSSLKAISLANYIDRIVMMGQKPDIVFVDYLNLMIPNKQERDANSYERVGEVCKELRALSYKYEIPFVTATQTNREGFNNPDVDLSNISDSAQTGHHTDMLGALTSNGPESGVINLTLIKNRFGRMGTKISYQMDVNSLRLTEISVHAISEHDPNPESIIEGM